MTLMDDNLRLSDNERVTAITALASHFTQGRLDHQEFDDRSLAISRAKTRADLRPLFSDLPGQLEGALAEGAEAVAKQDEDEDIRELKEFRRSGRRVENLSGIIFGLTLVTFLVLTFVFHISWAWLVWPSLIVTLPIPRLIHGFSDSDEKAYRELKEAEELSRKARLKRATERMKELEGE
jgi:hypothetical protein